MNIMEIKELLQQKEYEFLLTNEHLKDKIILLTLGGSYAYGTNVETSDVDIRGIALNSESDLIGLTNFEQVVNEATDTTIYSFNKIIQLLINCNPNTIEILGCKPEHYFQSSYQGNLLIENSSLFLSKRAVRSFGGYANQQLRRLQNAVARDKLLQPEKEEHIRRSMIQGIESFKDTYSKYSGKGIELFLDDGSTEDLEKEIFANIDLQHYPVRKFTQLINNIKNIVDVYEKLNKRNRKKDDAHLNKHAMHLIRLYHMAFDILEKKQIITYREDDHDFLMSIRNGLFQNSDGTYKQEFFDILTSYEERLKYARNHTDLPEHPDIKRIEELVMKVNRSVL